MLRSLQLEMIALIVSWKEILVYKDVKSKVVSLELFMLVTVVLWL
jgi:hypothetical protein